MHKPMTLAEAKTILQRPLCECGIPRERSRPETSYLCCMAMMCKLLPWYSSADERRARAIIRADARARLATIRADERARLASIRADERARVLAAKLALPVAAKAKRKCFAIDGLSGYWEHVDAWKAVEPDANCARNEVIARVMGRFDGRIMVRKFRRVSNRDS